MYVHLNTALPIWMKCCMLGSEYRFAQLFIHPKVTAVVQCFGLLKKNDKSSHSCIPDMRQSMKLPKVLVQEMLP